MDIHLHYTEKGAGRPLVLLHGNGEDGGCFRAQLDAFSKEYRVIAPDTRGHGQSPRGDAPFTIRQFAEDLRGFLDELGLERVDLLGFSDGGNTALVFALRYPERVGRLILNGANLDERGVKPWVQLPIRLGYRIASRAAKRDPKAARNAEMLKLMIGEPNVPTSELARIQSPTLVIAGTRDMIRRSHTRLIAASIPGAWLVLLPGGHFIAYRRPDEFNRAVEEFLRRTDMEE